MIRVKIGNMHLGITFQYEVIASSKENPAEVRRTWCELHRLGPPQTDKDGKVTFKSEAIVARAGGRCSPNQPGGFRYEVGRKVALARALKQYGLTRLQRTQVWAAYHDRPRPVNKPKPEPVKVQPIVDLDAPLQLDLPSADLGPQQADGFIDVPQARNLHTLDLNAGEGVH